jgi:hypothetical protein
MNFSSQPGLVVVNALLRTKAFEPSAVPHEAEHAFAVGAMIVHGFASSPKT